MEDVGLTERITYLRESWRPGHALLVIPVVLIAVITTLDIFLPEDIFLGPLLVMAPAITASFEGPVLTGVCEADRRRGVAHGGCRRRVASGRQAADAACGFASPP